MWVEPDFGNTVTRMETAQIVTSPSVRPRLHPESAGAASAMTLEAFLVFYIRNHVNQLTVGIKAEMASMIRRFFCPALSLRPRGPHAVDGRVLVP